MLESIFTTKRKSIYIAEIGLNHNGDYDTAALMIDSAALAGADAVKFQVFVPERLNSVYSKSLIETGVEGDADASILDFFRKLTLTADEYSSLNKRAADKGVVFFASVFDEESVELMETIDIPLYKLASSEVTNHSLIKRVANTGKPMILSTGISLEREISSALALFRNFSRAEAVLLHCVSLYPPRPEHLNLRRIISLKERFNVPVGYSDHSTDPLACGFAAAMGARIFEKHFTLSDRFECPDSAVSMTPEGFSGMISLCERAAQMTGVGQIDYSDAEEPAARGARRSLFAARDILAGEKIGHTDLTAMRPGVGIPEYMRHTVEGKTALVDIKKDQLLREDYIGK